jgi:hypothetical protein
MARIAWSVAGSRFYEAGVDRGVLYIGESAGVPWIGLISVDENPTGGEAKPLYLDGEKFLNLSSREEYEATIKAYTYPPEFGQCDGTAQVRPGLSFTQQRRLPFSFSYRTMVGNDTEGAQHGYKIHLVYNALVTPSTKSLSSFSDSIEASDFSWNLTTKARRFSGLMPTSHVVIDSRYTHPITLASIEAALYGSDNFVARMPTPEEIVDIYDVPVVFAVHDNGDGSYLVGGPDDQVTDIGLDQFIIDHPSVTVIDADTSTITY